MAAAVTEGGMHTTMSDTNKTLTRVTHESLTYLQQDACCGYRLSVLNRLKTLRHQSSAYLRGGLLQLRHSLLLASHVLNLASNVEALLCHGVWA